MIMNDDILSGLRISARNMVYEFGHSGYLLRVRVLGRVFLVLHSIRISPAWYFCLVAIFAFI